MGTMRKWEKTVTPEDAGKTLEKFLKENCFSKKEISRLKFKSCGMTVDGIQCRSTSVLEEGQKVVLHLEDEKISVKKEYRICENLPPLKICYEDADMLILDKPSGMSCHPGRGHYHDSLGGQAAAYLASKGEACTLRLIGRLDKDTSGAVIYAKNQTAAARLWEQRRNGQFHKTYCALIHGTLYPEIGEISLSLEKVPGVQNRMRAAEEGRGVSARTFYRTRKVFCRTEDTRENCKEISLVEFTLETGRTHQIRVHMASVGHPVLGDPFYGRPDGVKRLCLHAENVELRQPFTNADICLQIFFPFCQIDLDYFERSL